MADAVRAGAVARAASVTSGLKGSYGPGTTNLRSHTTGKLVPVRVSRIPGKNPIYNLEAGGRSKRFDPRKEEL